MCLLLDPYLLWLPSQGCSRERLVSFADGITRWRSAAKDQGIRCLLSDAATLALSEEGCYPSRGRLRDDFGRYGVVEYDANTVFRALEGFLRTQPYLERYTRLSPEDIILGPNGPSVRPAWLQSRLPARLGEALGASLALIAVICKASAVDAPFVLATADAEGDEGRAEVEFVLEMIQALGDHAVATVACPAHITESVPLARTLEEAIDALGLGALWASSVGTALHSACRRSVDADQRDAARLRSTLIHPDFRARVDRHRLSSGQFETILRKIALLIGKQGPPHPSLQVKPLRASGVQPVRQADGAKAMRAHLTEVGPGYRLHYWQLPDTVIELATVNIHEDFEIPR